MNIWVSGCFDILHAGHIDLFWYAKLYGVEGLSYHDAMNVNKLYVGVDIDDRVKFLKGNDRPINDLETRSKIISNLKMVNCVVNIISEEEHEYFIKAFNIDYIILGDNHKDRDVVGSKFSKHGVVYFPINNEYSTTKIIEKIKFSVLKDYILSK